MTLTPTLNSFLLLFKIHTNLSSVKERPSVLSDIISSHMQMKDYILYVLAPYVQAGAGKHNFTKKQKIYIKYWKKEEEHAMLFCQQDGGLFFIYIYFFFEGEGFFFFFP